MRRRSRVGIALVALTFAAAAAASAPVRPAPNVSLFYLKSGTFSLSLDTNKTGRKITRGAIFPHHNQKPVSGALAVCPGSSPVSEIHVGFPGVTLKLSKHHYVFSRSYTEKRAQIGVVGQDTTLITAKVRMTGTVVGRKAIKGTVSIQAQGCSLPKSTYRATVFKPG